MSKRKINLAINIITWEDTNVNKIHELQDAILTIYNFK